jgi:hypothetical protein
MKIMSKTRVMLTALAVPPLFALSAFAQYNDLPSVARIAYLSGNVSLQTSASPYWSVAPPNYPMVSGDRLYLDQDGRAVIQNGLADVRVWGYSDVTLTNLTAQYEQIGIAQGSIRVRIFNVFPGNTVEVDTPNGAVIIQQPGDYRVNVYPGQGSLVQVNGGSVQITGPGVNQEVDQGQAVQLYGMNPIEIGLVEMAPPDGLDQWSLSRDHHILYSASARYVSPGIPGYDDLDDYGSWTPTPDYGPVWFPNHVGGGWQPYTVGHWSYIAPWGYTWVDDAPWGYAPFHYGRWVAFGGRWGWVPGPVNVTPVYAPAFVAFVGGGPGGFGFGGGGGMVAWFPLGVAEPFVPWYPCSPAYVRNVNVTNVNITVIHNTTIVNNYNVFITRVQNVRTVNEINVTNVNYVNRAQVVAVNANAMTSGARVSQSVVHLNPQQQQQLARAPIAVASAPAPPPAHPSLQARTNVSRPVQRPVLMTPHGQAAATPAANTAHFAPAGLPKPAPAAAIHPATHTVAPNVRPAAPPANAAKPNAPAAPVNHPATPPPANHPPAPAPAPAARPSAPPPANRPPAPAPAAHPSAPPPANHPPAPAPAAHPSAPPPANHPPAPAARPSAPPPANHPPAPAARPSTPPPPEQQMKKTPPPAKDEKPKKDEEPKPE